MIQGCVSVVIPVYNVEDYLKECVDSVINQTYSNWELLLIDDGSKDKSGKICDEFEKLDSRIRVFHQNNEGVSFARNKGIENARGEYLIFIDSDDWIESLMFENMIDKINTTGTDACYCDRYFKDENNIQTILHQNFPEIMDSRSVLLKHLNYQFIASACLGMVKINRVKNVLFDVDIHTLEDWEYNFRVLNNLGSITVLKKPYYHYRTVEGSTSKSSLNEKKISCFLIPKKVNEYIKINNLSYREEAKYIPIFLINHMLVIFANNDYKVEYSKILKMQARRNLLYVWKCKNVPKKQKIYVTMCAISPRLFCIAYHLKYGGKYHD